VPLLLVVVVTVAANCGREEPRMIASSQLPSVASHRYDARRRPPPLRSRCRSLSSSPNNDTISAAAAAAAATEAKTRCAAAAGVSAV